MHLEFLEEVKQKYEQIYELNLSRLKISRDQLIVKQFIQSCIRIKILDELGTILNA